MVNVKLSAIAAAALCVSSAVAHGDHEHNNNKRHAEYLARRNMAIRGPAVIPTVTAAAGVPALSQITSGMPVATPPPAFTTFAAGATPPVTGAPPLPSVNIVATQWPALDIVPPTNGSEIQHWIQAVQAANIPKNPQTKDGSCDSDPELVPNAGPNGTCWWTCGGCLRDTDISTCPTKLDWGVSYDDGPSDYTPQLINYLNDEQIKATFFTVGSRVVSRPQTLQLEYMLGHQLSVHTWSHPALTSLTNEQIVAELGWTMLAMKAVTGVTPNSFRPPYGDIDDRVRAVAKVMGLTPILWTGSGDNEFDTDDWRIPGGTATGTSSYAAFNKILDLASSLATGFCVLEHDLYQQTVEMAIGYFLPLASQRSFNLKSINTCLGLTLDKAYLETSGNSTFDSTPSSSTTSSSGTVSGGSSKTSSGAGGKTTSGSGTGTQSPNAGQATQSSGAASLGARVPLGVSSGVVVGGVMSLVMMVAGARALF